jgi:serine protease AprX
MEASGTRTTEVEVVVPTMLPRIHLASWRFLVALAAFIALSFAATRAGQATAAATPLAPALERIAVDQPDKPIEVIVQARPGVTASTLAQAVERAGGSAGRELRLINARVATIRAAAAERLASDPAVRAVSLNASVAKTGVVDDDDDDDDDKLATAYNQSIRADRAWAAGFTGRGVTVAVIDTGIQGDLPDFRVSRADGRSRVSVSAVANPEAQNAGDGFGHGTHVAGLIAGNGEARDAGDPLAGRYVGVAPDANLISVKADDGQGGATVVDIIDSLQWVVDFKDTYDIRVVNLSLRSTVAESYKTDPLAAAAEAAWFAGIVVVAAAGNEGDVTDAVSYAPANDPYVITVGAVDDKGTKNVRDDSLATWSSRGTTQDGFAKPEILAPGARLVSTIPAGSEYTKLCPTCVVDGEYFRVGGTSMAAAVASGAIATLLQARPDWTPDQVKGVLMARDRNLDQAADSAGEVALDKALSVDHVKTRMVANGGLTPNQWIDPATGGIDYSRTSWSRTSWSQAVDPLRTSWSRTSWSRTSWSRTSWSASAQSCADLERTSWSRTSWSASELEAAKAECQQLLAEVDPTRTSWSRTSWSRTSWSTSFGR